MTKLRDLLGAAPEALYECMYTKHKTQKRKTWNDGFVTLYASRKLVLYDDAPPAGKVIDDAKMNAFDWERKDEEYISVAKFLIEIINETPITTAQTAPAASTGASNSYQSTNTASNASANGFAPRAVSSGALGGRARAPNPKFRTPVSHGPPRLTKLSRSNRTGHPYARNVPAGAAPSNAATPAFDFERNPTSEWPYAADAINRTPDEVLALLEK